MVHVIAHHRIADPQGFRHWTEEPMAGRPPHWRLVLFAPARDGSSCFCLWCVDSAQALQRLLDRALGDVARVECHEVDEDNALGLGGLMSPMTQHLHRL